MWVSVDWVRERLRFSSRADRVELGRLHRRRGESWSFVRIDRGVYLDLSDVPAGATKWELRRAISIARLFAVEKRLRSAAGVVFTGEAALAALGLDTWWNVPDITYRTGGFRRKVAYLPAVRVAGMVIGSVKMRHVTGGLQVRGSECSRDGGLLFAPEDVIIADLSRTAHPLRAFVGTCAVLRKMCRFESRFQAGGRRRERRVKDRILARFAVLKGQRCYRLALALVEEADCGTESPMEAALLWALKCGLPLQRSRKLVTQQPVTGGGGRYFLDVSLPEYKAVFEVDGGFKFGVDGPTVRRRVNQHTRRHEDITSMGWRVVHIVAEDLNTARILEVAIAGAVKVGLAKPGVPVRGRGRLWKPPGSEQFARNRRY